MYLKQFAKQSGKCLNNLVKKRKQCEIIPEKFILKQIDSCLRNGLSFSSTNSKQQSLKWKVRYQFGKLKQENDFQTRKEMQSKIRQWIGVNKVFLMRSIEQKNLKSQTNIEQFSGEINKQRPINTINSLILLLKDYNNGRCYQMSEIFSPKLHQEQINNLILQGITQLISTLHYIVSSLEFNLGAYEMESSKGMEMEFPYIGTLINTLVEILSFYCQPKSQQFDQFIICLVELIDLYLTSFIHMIKNPLQHLYVDDACTRLLNIKVNYSQSKINSLLKAKYNKIQSSRQILFHKSFQSTKNLPAYDSSKTKREYNYAYSEIDGSYFIFIKQQIRKIFIDSQLKGHISKLEQKIDLLIQKNMITGDNSMKVIKSIELYIEWIRRFQLYQDANQRAPQILIRLQCCIQLLIEFMSCVKNNLNQLSSTSFNLNCEESLIYLVYFYLQFASKLYSSKFIDSQNVKQFYEMIYDFVKGVFDGQQLLNKTNSKIHQYSSWQNSLIPSQRPKLACIQLEIFQSLIKLEDKVINSRSEKSIFTIIEPVISRYIKEEKYKNFPYLYLTWFYDRIVDILQLSKVQNFSQLKITVLNCVISAITENELNKLSNINRIHSMYLIIRHILQLQDSFRSQLGVNHNKILHWLCSHSREQLLTQDENELCDIFEYLLPMKSIYCEFLSVVVTVSFGEFSWEGFNKLYYHSLVFYQFQEADHKLKHSVTLDNPHFMNKRAIKQEQRMNIEYMRRYILNEYTAMGVRRREIPLQSYFYKILELQTPQTFYKNYFQNYGHHQ